MPLYEFYSPDTHKIYTFLARSLALRDKTPRCPEGDGLRMERRMSPFSVTGRHKKEPANEMFDKMSDEQLETIFDGMEAEMEGIDDTHPDPQQLARMMRKVSGLMGNKSPEVLRELISKLESGTDPEALEDQFAHIDNPHDPDSDPEKAAALDDVWAAMKKQFLGFKPVKRDPKVYELSEWI
jgi:hypothetical protein